MVVLQLLNELPPYNRLLESGVPGPQWPYNVFNWSLRSSAPTTIGVTFRAAIGILED